MKATTTDRKMMPENSRLQIKRAVNASQPQANTVRAANVTKGVATAGQMQPVIMKNTCEVLKGHADASPASVPLPPSPEASPSLTPLPDSPTPPVQLDEVRDDQITTHSTQTLPALFPHTPPSNITTVAHNKPELPAEGVDICVDAGRTPISALVSSIQRGFLFTPHSPLSPPQSYAIADRNEGNNSSSDAWAYSTWPLSTVVSEGDGTLIDITPKGSRDSEADLMRKALAAVELNH